MGAAETHTWRRKVWGGRGEREREVITDNHFSVSQERKISEALECPILILEKDLRIVSKMT